jgi:hypothetical protein
LVRTAASTGRTGVLGLLLGGQLRHPDDPNQARRRRLRGVQQEQQLVDRGEQVDEVQRRRAGRADRRGPVADQEEPGGEHGGHADELGEVEPAEEPRLQPHHPQREVHDILRARPRPLGVPA